MPLIPPRRVDQLPLLRRLRVVMSRRSRICLRLRRLKKRSDFAMEVLVSCEGRILYLTKMEFTLG